jgi:hypothetical protein
LLGTSKGTELVRFAAAARRRRRSKTNDRPAVIENTKGEGERAREREREELQCTAAVVRWMGIDCTSYFYLLPYLSLEQPKVQKQNVEVKNVKIVSVTAPSGRVVSGSGAAP